LDPTNEPTWIAHRGGEPENSLEALISVLSPGSAASGIEFDVQLSADDVPIVFHDHETERLTGEGGTIVDRSWKEIARLQSLGQKIPRLQDLTVALLALETSPRHLNVEFKPTSRSIQLIDACTPFIERMQSLSEVVVSSFDPRVIDALLKRRPSWKVAYLYEDLAALEALRFFPQSERPLDLHPKHNLLTQEHVQEYGHAHMTFRTWTVDDSLEVKRLLQLGVRHIISNIPNTLAKEFQETTTL
jgi:glycerophosphoryl diester phosphodiesterase